MRQEYQIVIGSPIDHEELVVYLLIDNRELLLISKDEGIDKLKIEMIDCDGVIIGYDTFIEALDVAKKELLK